MPKAGYIQSITTYCGMSDIDLKKPHFVTQSILSALGKEPAIRIRISIWALTDTQFAAAMCGIITGQTEEVTLSVQKDTRSQIVVEFLAKCAASKGVKMISTAFQGLVVGGINSYHPKLFFIETPTRLISFVGSGNLTFSRNNIDYLVRLPDVSKATSAPSDQLTNWIGCITKSLNAPAFDGSRDSILSTRQSCEKLTPSRSAYILPADARRILMRMAYLSAEYSELKVVSQGFNSADIVSLGLQVLREGKSVKVLLDDDIYWARFDPRAGLMNDEYEYSQFLTQLLEAGAEVRYVITNHNDLVGNYQHGKAYIYSGKTDDLHAALVGSANATASAFSDNVEVMVELNSQQSKDVSGWFDSLWARSIPHGQMPIVDPLRH